jgi:hypothetical protein
VKVIIKLEDSADGTGCTMQTEFFPPVENDTPSTPAGSTAIRILQFLGELAEEQAELAASSPTASPK